MILDGFDGTIARLTKTESNFGMHLDSLVDAISFGLVVSVFIYIWGFQGMYSQIGKIVSFIYLSAGVIRLARFNIFTQVKAYPSHIFIGVPIPLAALSILSVILIFKEPLEDKLAVILFSSYVIIISFLMISNIKYRTLKRINSKNSLLALFILAILVAFAIMYPSYTVPVISFLYISSPLLFYFSRKKRKHKPLDENHSAPKREV